MNFQEHSRKWRGEVKHGCRKGVSVFEEKAGYIGVKGQRLQSLKSFFFLWDFLCFVIVQRAKASVHLLIARRMALSSLDYPIY